MIESFFEICANGIRMEDGLLPQDIPLMEWSKPEYKVTHYAWIADGVEYTRAKDNIETQSMCVAPNKKHFVVKQSAGQFGPDNILILRQDGSMEQRLNNPYRSSAEFRPEAKYWFEDVRIIQDKLWILIGAEWQLPDKSFPVEPHFGTYYDCNNWEYTPLEHIDSRNL
jgi:hypothetical protein